MNAEERNLINGIKEGLYEDQKRFYLNYTAAITTASLAGISNEEATRIVDTAVEENLKDMEKGVKAANQLAMNFLENLLGLGKQ